MSAKLNKEFIDQYRPVFTDQLIQRSFEQKEHLTGKDLLHLTSFKQLNLFVLKILFAKWQDEMKRLESPYFDYKHPDVRKSMVGFMNALSQRIRVDAEALKPLVMTALDDALLVTTSPLEYITQELSSKSSKILTNKILTQILKYLVTYKDEVEEYLKSQENRQIEDVIFEINENFPPLDNDDAIETAVASLSETLVLNRSDLIGYQPTGEPTVLEEEDGIISEDDEPDVESEVEEDVTAQETVEDVSTEDATLEEVISEVETTEEPPGTINDRFEVEAKTLADLHEETKLESIMDGISINHKYMFVQELFDGNNDQFTKAISEVEECDTFDNAVELLVQSYAKENEWDMNSDEVKELLKVVFRKFR